MTIDEKIKTIDNKIQQNRAQYNLNRETVKILALSAGNVHKYEFLTGRSVYLSIHYYVMSWKSKLKLQKTSINF